MALNLNDIKKRTQENKEKKVSIDPRSYSYLVYSLPDGGKTSLVSGMFEGKHLMLATEYGAKACLCANEIEVASFKDLKEMSKVLSDPKSIEELGYSTLIVDTATKVGSYIESYILSRAGKQFMDEVKKWNGAYALVTRYFDEIFDPIKSAGWNIVWTCHATVEELTDNKGYSYLRYEPQSNKRILDILKKEMDYVWFIDKRYDDEGKVHRFLVTDECKTSFGKNKTNKYVRMPLEIELEKNEKDSAKKVWTEVERAIKGFGEDNITTERKQATIGEFTERYRDINEIKEDVVKLGGECAELGLRDKAILIMNKALGTDSEGVQRTLDEAIQDNAEALELCIEEMKDLIANNK